MIFSDFAVSGSSTDRPGFEAMMAAVEAGRVGAIVTEDLSRITRDFADAAFIFKRLQYLQRRLGTDPPRGAFVIPAGAAAAAGAALY
jgi:DNA invertase Pin-like site-specific DNA recombinase